MRSPTSRFAAPAIVWLSAISLTESYIEAAVVAPIAHLPGASANVTVGVSITTVLGTSSDTDIKTVAVTGNGQAAFMPNVPPFAATQVNSLNLNFANTTFTFQLFCLGPFCQTLNISVTNLVLALTQPMCAPISPANGAVAFSNGMFRVTGSYRTTGIATSSGVIDNTDIAPFNGRITTRTPGNIRFDQLAVADQVIVVPADQLPTGVTAMTLTFTANLANTVFTGPYSASANSFDLDSDGVFDACDNCPAVANATQGDHDLDGVGNACDCVADVAPIGGGDGIVNVTDLLAVIGAWGNCANPANCPPDAAPATATSVGDGVVNVSDLLLIISEWGPCT